MDKKFKNKVAFTGPIALRKAMVEELLKIGYKWVATNKNDYGSWEVTISNYGDKNGGFLGNCGLPFSEVTKCTKYQLPEQWDECLKAASEIEENFVLPKNWHVLVTKENQNILLMILLKDYQKHFDIIHCI